MHFSQSIQPAIAIAPAVKNNGSFIGQTVDTRGYAHALFVFSMGDSDVAATVFKVQESDGEGAWSDISGAAYTGSDLPSATSDYRTWQIAVRQSKRFLKLVVTVASGSVGCAGSALCILSEATNSPVSGATVSGFSGFSGSYLTVV